MKIGLINPGSAYVSNRIHQDMAYVNGISFVAESLARAGHDVRTVNFAHDPNANLRDVRDCDVFGATSLLECYGAFQEIMPQLKATGKPIVVGGPLMSSYGRTPTNVLMRAFPEIDFGVIGEGELTTPKLMDFLAGKTREMPGGVVFRKGDTLETTGEPEIVQNLDDLPEVDFSRWKGFSERVAGEFFNVPQLARGCYNRCSFCYLIDKKHGIRSYTPGRMEKELANALSLKPKGLHFSDDTFSYDQERAMKVGDLLAEKGVLYEIQTRVSDVNLKLMKHLKETGCIWARFGIESFDEGILKKCGKNITRDQIYRAIGITQEAGIGAMGFFIFGLPGETKKTIETTLKGIEETQLIPRARILIPLPGTRVYNEAIAQGKIKDEIELLRSYPLQERGGDTVSGNFVPINLTENLTDQDLIEARDRANALRDTLSSNVTDPGQRDNLAK